MEPLDPVMDAIDKAESIIYDLNLGDRTWTLSIPAHPKRDPDIIITNALRLARAEVQSLREAAQPKVPEFIMRGVDALLAWPEQYKGFALEIAKWVKAISEGEPSEPTQDFKACKFWCVDCKERRDVNATNGDIVCITCTSIIASYFRGN